MLTLTPAEISEVDTLEEAYASNGVAIFSPEKFAQPDGLHEFEIVRSAIENGLFIDATPETVFSFGGSNVRYEEISSLHVDRSHRIVHLVLQGQVQGYFAQLVGPHPNIIGFLNEELSGISPQSVPSLKPVVLSAGQYVAFDGFFSGNPTAHGFKSLTPDRLSATHRDFGPAPKQLTVAA